ncbi:MAG: hypothetical protein E7048_03775 [Lentisphaerae bacterium]|nr:hypothetical protein [Lentisphaerota bacterium]MBR2872847.1 hypothetical protein [Lentisphaeria bacterium]
MAEVNNQKKRRPRQKGELRSYLYSGGFHRLEGKSTAPGSLAKPEHSTFRTICLISAEILFLAVGLWYMFR